MKVLIVSPVLPYPLFSGGQVRLYNLLKNLGQKHQINLFSFIRKDEEQTFLPELLKYCRKVEVFKKRKPWSPQTLLKTTFSFYPLLMTMYHFPEFKKKLGEELENGKYDLIHFECFYTMHNLPKNPLVDRLPLVLAEQNVEYLVYQRFAQNFSFRLLKPLLYLDISKIRFWEKHFWQKADRIVAMSDEEAKIINLPKVEVVENGVDSAYFKQITFKKKWPQPTVLFVGNFRWLQNRDALSFLVKEIWPQIQLKIPEARLWVVGKYLSGKIKNLLPDGAILDEGMVDIREAYQGADLLLAPIRVGGGTSYKVLEATASGLPVITTPLGIEGIEAKNGQEVVVENSGSELAQATVELLRDEGRRKKIGQNAQKLVSEKYNWQKISQKLEKVWREAVSGKKN